ncbi:MAG: Neutral/alkaline non-lysosomal ceramidase [Prosthecobacter sp.]|nr:Neutral/alkaline non-lysosomal ceramidase [Prosthecobacter sp.]
MKILCIFLLALVATARAEMLAGVAKVDITDRTVPLVNDPCFAKALVLKSGGTTAVLITLDAVAVGGIGRIGNGFMATVRDGLQELGVPPSNVVVNASHCHGMVRGDLEPLVIQAVKTAMQNLVPVKAGTGVGAETRISENRRLKMKDGSTVDMRRAYSMPRDEEVASVGPIDPQVGVLRLDRADGTPLAMLYQFACHPIMNPPSKGCSADYPGFASKVIEDATGAMAFFVQGCGGDINPVRYKEVTRTPDAEPLGTLLGATVLAAARKIETKGDGILKVSNATIAVPRAADYTARISSIEAEQKKLLAALKPTNINFKSFLPLLLQHKLWPDTPSHYSQSYLHDQALDRKAISQLDADNRLLVENYLANVEIMERLTRLNANLALLQMHLKQTQAAGEKTLDAEVCGLRVGDFKLVTFPGEVTVQVGLNIKKAAGDVNAHVSGYTNGYIWYTPTVEQRLNPGYAQEDCDTLVAPEWQKIFETKALEVLRSISQ